MTPTGRRHFATPRVFVTGLLVAVLAATGLAGCADDQRPQHVGAEGGPKTEAKPTDPTAYESYISGEADDKAVERSSQLADLDADVVVTVSYSDGSVEPVLTDVQAEVGDEIKVEVTSDEHQKVSISGHPDATSDVDPGEPEDVEFTPNQAGRTKVSLEPADETLVTFVVVG